MSERVSPIRPELLAAKIERIENFEEPKLLEEFGSRPQLVSALWYLQHVSQPRNYAGGLTKFAHDLVAHDPLALGTPQMLAASPVDRYTIAQAVKIVRELPLHVLDELFGDDAWIYRNTFKRDWHAKTIQLTKPTEDYYFGISFSDDDEQELPPKRYEFSRAELEQKLLAIVTPAALRDSCLTEARESLARYFKEVCESPCVAFRDDQFGSGAPWYFSNVGAALLAFIEHRADAVKATLAQTEITTIVERWVRKSRSIQRSVLISGNSRFGKTEAIKLQAAMHPGLCRLVNTPATSAISDLLREVALALGIEVGPRNVGRELREQIDYVLRFSRLQLIFDEAQFAILPTTYSRNTAPARLNWIRRAIIDQGISAVFVCTPQSYLPAKRKFERTTGFAMQQFEERIFAINLPDELSRPDLLAVARVHFPDLRSEYLEYVVDKALATERNYISDIEKIATLARDEARENGRPAPKLCDIERAIADVLPTIETPAPASLEQASRTVTATPLQASRRADPKPLQEDGVRQSTLPILRRGKPATQLVS